MVGKRLGIVQSAVSKAVERDAGLAADQQFSIEAPSSLSDFIALGARGKSDKLVETDNFMGVVPLFLFCSATTRRCLGMGDQSRNIDCESFYGVVF
ncbi:MAG: hypothetical protein JRJ60_10565 [Deltaproteobacteria bacterium]|nr:hypothetical protein [Deltaproteobacteria bacterium]